MKSIKIILVLLILLTFMVSPALSEGTGKAKIVSKVELEEDNGDSDLKESKYDAVDSNGKTYRKTGWLSDIDQLTKKKEGSTGLVDDLTLKPDAKKTITLEEAKENNAAFEGSDNDDSTSPDEDKEDEGDSGDHLGLGLMLTNAVKDGIFAAMKGLADDGFNAGMDETNPDVQAVSENHGMIVGVLYLLMTIEWDPSTVDAIMELQVKSYVFFLFLLTLWVLLGATSVNIYAITSKKHARSAMILSNRYHLPINEYMITLAECYILASFGYLILRFVLLSESILTKLIVVPIIDRIAPTSNDSTLLWILFVILFIGSGIAFALRLIVIGITHACFMIGVGLHNYGFARDTIQKWFIYYCKVVFLRPLIILITLVGVAIITSIQLEEISNPFFGVGTGMVKLLLSGLLTAAMLIMILFVSWTVLFEIKEVLRSMKYMKGSYRFYRGIKGAFF